MNNSLIMSTLLLLFFPLGIAAQKISFFVVLALFIFYLRKHGQLELWRNLQRPSLAAMGAILCLLYATTNHPQHSMVNTLEVFAGYSPWLILPHLIVRLVFPRHSLVVKNFSYLLAAIGLVLGVVAVSQISIGWKMSGTHFVSAPLRASGFYSHPLTFAYVIFLLWPLALFMVSKFKNWESWLFLMGIGLSLFCSFSRTVLLIALLITVVHLMFEVSKKWRIRLLSSIALLFVIIASTDNLVREKFLATFFDPRERTSHYANDRLAFWHAHWVMIQEKPWLGHGANLSPEYRLPYYAAIGLKDTSKPYEAHNMFIELVTESGIISLLFFLIWYGYQLRWSWQLFRQKWTKSLGLMFLFTFGGFLLVSLTQNSFQDDEVRYVLALFSGFLAWSHCYQFSISARSIS